MTIRPILQFTPDGKNILLNLDDKGLSLIQRDGTVQQRFDFPQTPNTTVVASAVRLLADGKTLAGVGETHEHFIRGSRILERDEPVVRWNLATGKRLGQFMLKVAPGNHAELSPNGRVVAFSWTTDLHHVETGDTLALQDKMRGGYPMAFSPDGRVLAVTEPSYFDNKPKSIVLYESMTGQRVAVLDMRLPLCRDLTFSPDGRLLVTLGTHTMQVWHWSQNTRVWHVDAEGTIPNWVPDAFGRCVAFSPDSDTLATGHADGTILLWNLADARKRMTVAKPDTDIAQSWAELAKDAPTAYAAIDRLVATPKQTLAYFRPRLAPTKLDANWLAEQLKQLDSGDFAERESASKALAKIAEVASVELKRELEQTKSEEVKRRLRALLSFSPIAPPSAEVQRQLRALVVLERIGSPDAVTIVRHLASGDAGARLTREAKETLRRLAK